MDSSMWIAKTGLDAQQTRMAVISNNLANVNNPAYARQRVIFGDRGTVITPEGAQSLGIEAMGMQQLRDGLLDRQVMRELALQASFSAEQSAYQRAQAGLGQNIDRSSAAAAAGSTAASWSATTPTSPASWRRSAPRARAWVRTP